MNPYLRIVLEILLEPWTTFSTQVYLCLQTSVLFFFFFFQFILFNWDEFLNGNLITVSPADTLTVESLLELLDEESLRKDTALPSPIWSSDHTALLAEFRCKSRSRR